MQKRPPPKVALQQKPAPDSAVEQRKPAAARGKNARLLQWAQLQDQAHDVLDQLGVAESAQQLRKEIDAAAAQKIKSLTALLQQLMTTPQRSQQLQRRLTQQQYEQYQSLLLQPNSVEDLLLLEEMPSVLRHYQQMISAGDRLNALADGAATRRKGRGRITAHRAKAEAAYEEASMWLDGQLQVVDAKEELRIRAWLDRDFDYSAGGNVGADCVGVARIKGSSSEHCLVKSRFNAAERRTLKHERQLQAVSDALRELIYSAAPEVEQTSSTASAKLQQLLNMNDD